MLVNVQGHPFGIFLATLENSGKIPTFCRNVGILTEQKKYAGSDLLVRARGLEPAYFLCSGKIPTFLQNVGVLPEFFKVAKKIPKGFTIGPWTMTNILM